MSKRKVIIIGAGPCGLSAAIECEKAGFDVTVIERGNIVHALYRYPTHQQFFSTSEKLAIGDIPFYSTERKPKRNEALVYYRKVVEEYGLTIEAYEEVTKIDRLGIHDFKVTSVKQNGLTMERDAHAVIVATGYYDSPNYMHIPGEDQKHVFHYFHEAHPFYNQKVAVIGGKNSAIDAALELEKAGAEVSVYCRYDNYSSSIKPWILPDFESLVKQGKIMMHFETEIHEIGEDTISVSDVTGTKRNDRADFVFAMTGYHPDHSFIRSMGVEVDMETGRPVFNSESMETNVDGIYIAGVIAAGNNANEIFIENGRHHGGLIASHLGAQFHD
ncbi:YpdA family putative bacillithiol disulfide reductase [Salisediminibacterium selenitireducens]|uniref:HI0933 family protein n=1 Tax=Bacillus selenitireducens (strain ATCC 700615 / DSM 15326 / MLS10) TaxID=439292 RepID=D6XVB9_BACIE|nr:YpdA family putative bacillithiol disulfide reductase [Salisediminibacterium selenitireducens]ADH99657.1 HI0933 family protein [[Bacillus] selenitireducens MLS10]